MSLIISRSFKKVVKNFLIVATPLDFTSSNTTAVTRTGGMFFNTPAPTASEQTLMLAGYDYINGNPCP